MLAIFKNDWKRLLEEKIYLFVSIGLTICSIVAAIVLTTKVDTKVNIAVVLQENPSGITSSSQLDDSPYFNITVLNMMPPKSELLQNRYDAIVTFMEDGSYNIDTIKSDEVKEKIEEAINNPDTFVPNTHNERKIGANIIGYMMMFLLMQGIFYARLFAEDKEKHMIERVVLSPIAFGKYLFGHGAFIMVMIFIPNYSVIVVAKMIGVDVGFSLSIYAGLIAVLTILSTAFALFLNSFFRVADTANMLGSSLIILSSILAGSFYSFTKEETLFDKLIHILPQKDFINFVNALEKGSLTTSNEGQFLYVMALSILFFFIAIIKTRKDYIYHQ